MSDPTTRFRRRFLVVAVAIVVMWTVVVAVSTAIATGMFGDLGLPTDGEGRPRGLLVIGGSTLLVVALVTVVYRRASGPVSDLLRAADQVGSGNLEHVDVKVRGPGELRLLAVSFNEMAARLAANEAQRRRFLADITHELRNPLAVLQSQIEAQLDGVHERDDRHLSSLLDETRRLSLLVDDLHTLALAETGRLVLRQEPAALGALVREVVGRHEAQARQRLVVVRATVAPDIPEALIDSDRIGQVLDNLVTNAIRHSPDGGEVRVEVEVAAACNGGARPTIRCSVTDAGPGFPDDQWHDVFDRFTSARDSSGSGLGLSIARDLVRAHGGTIEASNRPAPGGASVTFTVPVA